MDRFCTVIFGCRSFYSKIYSLTPSEFSVVMMVTNTRLGVQLIIVIFAAEMFVSFNCSAVIDLKVRLTAVYGGAVPVDGQRDSLAVRAGTVPPVSACRGRVVPVKLLHVPC